MTIEEIVQEEFQKRADELANNLYDKIFKLAVDTCMQLADSGAADHLSGRQALMLLATSIVQEAKTRTNAGVN